MESGREEIQDMREKLSLLLESGTIGYDLSSGKQKKAADLIEGMMIFIEEFCWLYRMNDVEQGTQQHLTAKVSIPAN